MMETALCCDWHEADDDADALDRLTRDHMDATGHDVHIVAGDERPAEGA